MFIESPPLDAAVSALYAREQAQQGFVMNLTRAWAWQPKVADAFSRLRALLIARTSLSPRERAVLVCATAAALGDSYCSLAWGTNLASLATPAAAASVLKQQGASVELTQRELRLATWAAKVVRSPNETSTSDIDGLRHAGFTEREIFDATALVAFRLAFSTVNDALGVRPDRVVVERAPEVVRNAVTFGRDAATDGDNHG